MLRYQIKAPIAITQLITCIWASEKNVFLLAWTIIDRIFVQTTCDDNTKNINNINSK